MNVRLFIFEGSARNPAAVRLFIFEGSARNPAAVRLFIFEGSARNPAAVRSDDMLQPVRKDGGTLRAFRAEHHL